MNSALAGYLMLSAKEMTNSLAALPPEALAELGALQASIQAGIEARSLSGERSVNGLIPLAVVGPSAGEMVSTVN
jgi:diadenosine tetraphosphate (Ap4A) HIT family hydrolase